MITPEGEAHLSPSTPEMEDPQGVWAVKELCY